MSLFNSTSQSSLFVKTVTSPPVSDVQNLYDLIQLVYNLTKSLHISVVCPPIFTKNVRAFSLNVRTFMPIRTYVFTIRTYVFTIRTYVFARRTYVFAKRTYVYANSYVRLRQTYVRFHNSYVRFRQTYIRFQAVVFFIAVILTQMAQRISFAPFELK
jgi:hypothetical protein